jgi:hypothetical protein
MSTYRTVKDQQDAVAEARQQAQKDAYELEQFLKRHEADGVIICDANRQRAREYLNGDDLSEANLEDAWTHPNFRKSLAMRETPEDTRNALNREIYALLQGSDTARQHTIIQLKYSTTEELIARRDELVRRKAAREKTPHELRADLQAARPGAPDLPDEITREQILQLWSPEQFRFWAKKVGMPAITKRINEGRN